MKTRTSFIAKDTRFTVEETPIEIGTIECEFEVECSVQEMAQSGSTLMNVMKFVKDSIKEAQASAQAYQPSCTSTPATTTAKTTAENKVETPNTEQHWDLQAIWGVMVKTLPEGFKKSGIGHYTYESGSLKEKNRIRIVVCFKPESIDCDITVKDSTAFCHLYEDGTEGYISGVNPGLMEELVEELPEDVRGFIANYIKKVLNK